MIHLSAAKRAETPDEVGNVAALSMRPDGGFITDRDYFTDGGVPAAYRFGELSPREIWGRNCIGGGETFQGPDSGTTPHSAIGAVGSLGVDDMQLVSLS